MVPYTALHYEGIILTFHYLIAIYLKSQETLRKLMYLYYQKTTFCVKHNIYIVYDKFLYMDRS